LLRCTLAGSIALMMSEKYSCLSEDFYQRQKGDFDKIVKSKSYHLIRDLPVEIASRILSPEIPKILSSQKSNGLWNNSTRVTYDILSAFNSVGVLYDLIVDKKLKNAAEQLADEVDYYSLLIKTVMYKQTNKKDIEEKNKLIQDIQRLQRENGSWDETVVATAHQLEKLINLGVPCDDQSVQEAIEFLFKNFSTNWVALQGSGKPYGLQTQSVFSTMNRDREFEAAKKYEEENDPKLICFRHLGIMQNSLTLKLFMQIGLEHDKRVESALDNIYRIYKNYGSLCYFRIQKKFVSQQTGPRKSVK
jgi:hypothetical protein